MINITIDNRKIQCREGDTILPAAREAGIFIPTLCYDPQHPAQGACGLCIVEVVGNRRLARACATPVYEGMVVNTCTSRIKFARKNLLELQLSDHSGDCQAPCRLACPAETDCQGYVSLITQGRLQDAYQRMMQAHPFPGSIARVCPRPCETKCRRGIHDQSINIAGLKRFVADECGDYTPTIAPDTGKNVAIIGGGPAGLTAAYFIRQAGHGVDVYEKSPKLGGLLRYGIPEYRLPKAVLDVELGVFERMGVGIYCDYRHSADLIRHFALDAEYNQHHHDYDAVIIAIGAGISRPMGIPGEELPGVIGGIEFLRDATQVGQAVVVIGGSNTAIDAARTALRLGAKIVTVAYRRTKDEMPADPVEIAEAEEEGVNFIFLVAPIEVTLANEPPTEACPASFSHPLKKGDCGTRLAERNNWCRNNQKANGIKLQVMTLGDPDSAGRRSPMPLDGQETWLEADMIITAIGQAVELKGLETLDKSWSAIAVDTDTFMTSQAGVFAIGDATGQSAYAIEAIGHGRKAARAVHEFLQTDAPPWETLPSILCKDEKSSEDFARIPKAPREDGAKKKAVAKQLHRHCVLDTQSHSPLVYQEEVGSRVKHGMTKQLPCNDFDELHLSLTAEQAAREAGRCLSCGCGDYSDCMLITLANKYDANPAKYHSHQKPQNPIDTSNPLFAYDANKCVLCGLCVKACARDRAVLTMANRGYETMVVAHPQSNCAKCGSCAAVCPVGARSTGQTNC